VVLDPTDLGATIVVAPGQMPCNFLPSSDADYLPFQVKLVPFRQASIQASFHQQIGGLSMLLFVDNPYYLLFDAIIYDYLKIFAFVVSLFFFY
jgi:hypothetical protein